MSVNSRTIATTPDRVWDVLADGWLYPLWVVGASRIRDVDADWPEKGSRIHHSIGAWPLLIDDHTEVREVTPGRSLTLRAKGWPLGEAKVVITLTASGAHTDVVIEEDAVAGPGVLVPEPLKGLTLKWRNVETLRRLAYVAEGRA
ncbi:SRPBCC domain-containing protein [Aeromicrobium sp.]|uniref:SRPBCC family protein n=1 Tax=Aeromicrobium sp. TaxID=1871063 RepID=UPI0019A9F4A8|nr:SRPBCC domain-containing protein [Aeromicrobium sp.]MBC7632925.1 SRPBCC domain-containing protein [Aeromicrobium sp.]